MKKAPPLEPEYSKLVHGYQVGAFRKEIEDNEVIGQLLGKDITRKEAKEHLEILQDFRFLPTQRMNSCDWKCEYCGGLRPKTEYKCGYCGGPRRDPKDKDRKQKSKDYSDDDSTTFRVEM